jgi:transcriptional regulator with XRE-family HTH domain
VTNIKPGTVPAPMNKRAGRPRLDTRASEAARRLRQARERLALTVAEAAARIGLSASRYRFLEKKFGPVAEAAYLPALAASLMVDPAWLSHGTGHAPPLPAPSQPLSWGERAQFGARAKLRREQLGFSRADIAAPIGIAAGTLLQWERAVPAVRKPAEARWEAALDVPDGWLRNMAAQAPPAGDRSTARAVMPAAATVADEIRGISCWLCRRHPAQRTTDYAALEPSEQRAVDVIALRCGLHGEHQSTLHSIGMRFGLTRERIRQIITKHAERALQVQLATPCLDRLADEIKKQVPATVARLDEKLTALLGESLSVTGAERFAREVLGRSIACLTNKPADMAVPWHLVATADNDTRTIREVRAAAIGMIRRCGAAHVAFVSSAAGAGLDRAVSTEETLRCCRLVDSFEWLDEENGWFWFGPEMDNRLLSIATKVLSVANRNVDVEEIHGALVRTRRSRYQPEHPRQYLIDPPPAVTVEVLKRAPAIRNVQHDDFRPKQPIRPEDVLSTAELAIYRVLSNRGGIATRHTLHQELVETGILFATALQAPLEGSPILRRLDQGLYALRGTTLSPQSWARASATAHSAVPTQPGAPNAADGA